MNARETALWILYRIEGEERRPDGLLGETLREARLSRRDRALVTELVNGVMRWRRRLDGSLNHLLKGRRAQDLTPWIRNILRLGLYQIQFLDRIPVAAATHQAVSMAKRYGHRGTASLVNAVLRQAVRSAGGEPPYPAVERDPVGYIGLRYSHPDWMVQRWLKRYGLEETLAFCQANNRVPDLVVRANPLKATEAQLKASLDRERVAIQESLLMAGFFRLKGVGDITQLTAFRQGFFQVQDESTALAVLLLAPRPGEVIVDLCSAPGGKTTHLASLMDDRGVIVAVDLSARRLKDLVANCRRLGLSSVYPLLADGRTLCLRGVDRVLVDAPCSGLGVLARRTDLRWRKRPESISHLVELQFQLSIAAADLLKPGGVMVYSTCTIEDEENEQVVARLLSQRQDLVLENAGSLVPSQFVTTDGFVRTFPHRHGLDGTFAARLRKAIQDNGHEKNR